MLRRSLLLILLFVFSNQSRADISIADVELALANAQDKFGECQNEIGCAYSWMFGYLGDYQYLQGRITELRAKSQQFILPWVNSPGWVGEAATADYALVNQRADTMTLAIDAFTYHYNMATMYRGMNTPPYATYAWLAWGEGMYALNASVNVFLVHEKQEYYALAIAYFEACWTFSHASSQFAMSAQYYANGFWESQMEAMDVITFWENY